MNWFALLREDFRVVGERDPATRSKWSILTLHSGFWAVAAYRLQHALWERKLRWPARFLAVFSRWLTGVEIHPAVTAGRRLFLDHGMGIVIGETAVLGDDVSIYQGVTLGGTSWAREKRHPSVGNNVIIGAGAKVIGAITLADNVRVGCNAVVVKDVPAHTTVVGIPARAVNSPTIECEAFEAYAQSGEVSDPVMQLLDKMNRRLERLEQENAALRLLVGERNNG